MRKCSVLVMLAALGSAFSARIAFAAVGAVAPPPTVVAPFPMPDIRIPAWVSTLHNYPGCSPLVEPEILELQKRENDLRDDLSERLKSVASYHTKCIPLWNELNMLGCNVTGRVDFNFFGGEDLSESLKFEGAQKLRGQKYNDWHVCDRILHSFKFSYKLGIETGNVANSEREELVELYAEYDEIKKKFDACIQKGVAVPRITAAPKSVTAPNTVSPIMPMNPNPAPASPIQPAMTLPMPALKTPTPTPPPMMMNPIAPKR